MPKTRINVTIDEDIHKQALKQKDKRYQPTLSSYITYLIKKDGEQLEQQDKQQG